MKMVKAGSAPLDPATAPGRVIPAVGARAAYVARVLGFVDIAELRPLKILANAGNGAEGPTFDAIIEAFAAAGAPLEVVRLHHTPDGSFPNGIHSPLLEENQPVTAEVVRAEGADIGIAWDGDRA